jgi:hypothetical protein
MKKSEPGGYLGNAASKVNLADEDGLGRGETLLLFPLSANEVGGEGWGEVVRFNPVLTEIESGRQPLAGENDGFVFSALRQRNPSFCAKYSRFPEECLPDFFVIDDSKSAILRYPPTQETAHVPRHAVVAPAFRVGIRQVRRIILRPDNKSR